MTKRFLIAAIASTGIALAGGTAAAAPSADRGDDFVFTYDRLAFSDEERTRGEYDRLNRAIKRYCQPSGRRGASAYRRSLTCRTDVMAACEPQMPAALYALHAEMKKTREA